MTNYFTGMCILLLGICVMMTALPEYREMDRKEEFLTGCMEDVKKDGEKLHWDILACEQMWNS